MLVSGARRREDCRVAPGDCSPEALTRTGLGGFHHPALPLMWLMAMRPRFARESEARGSTTFRIAGDMSPDVNAPVMGPFESSHQHGPPLLGRVRGPPVPRRPRSYAALRLPPSRRPRLRSSLAGGLPCPSCDKEEEGPPRCLGRPLPACRRLRPRWVRVSACPSRRDRHRLQAAQCPGHPE